MLTLILALLCNIYFANATVVEIENDTVVFETEDGNVWAVEGNDFQVGDNVTVKFHNNGTDVIEDDVVLRIYAER